MFNRKPDNVCKTMKQHNPEPVTPVNIFVGESQSEFLQVVEDEVQEPELYDKNALYKIPGCSLPPGETDKGVKYN